MASPALSVTFSGTGTQTSNSVSLPRASNNGDFTLSIVGLTGSGGTITIQRSYDNGTNWGPILPAYTADAQDRGVEPVQGTLYRLQMTGQTSGAAICQLG